MTSGWWAQRADEVLEKMFARLPKDASDAAIRRAVQDAYPFGPREHWPYKVWLARVKVWRAARAVGHSRPADIPRSSRPRIERHDTETLNLFPSSR